MENQKLLEAPHHRNRIFIGVVALVAAMVGWWLWTYAQYIEDEMQATTDGQSVVIGENTATAGFTLSEVEGWQTYTNEEFGFEVEYPSDVTTEFVEDENLLVLRRLGMDGPALYFSIDLNPIGLTFEEYYDGDPGPDVWSGEDFSVITVGGVSSFEFNSIVSFAGGSVIIVPRGDHFINISDTGGSFQGSGLLDQILSTFRFLE